MTASALYRGTVEHHRREPKPHGFRYRLFLPYLDLAELPELFAGRLLWSLERPNVVSFRRADYLGPADVPLDVAVRDRVERELGFRPTGPVRMLGNLRMFGYCFNPVVFYYCFEPAADGEPERLVALVAEITNTPWGERHAYVFAAAPGRDANEDAHEEPSSLLRFRFQKDFHVSPFFGMDLEHDWRFAAPGELALVHMKNRIEGRTVFDASLRMERLPWTAGNLARCLARHPATSAKVHLAIYLQALLLWLKRTPFHPHPNLDTGASGPEAPAK